MQASQLLVVTLHSSTARPPELKNEWLSDHQSQLLEGDAAETDRFTSQLYDWRAILGNQHMEFPYSQVYINASRHPQDLAQVVPLQIRDQSIYSTKLNAPGVSLWDEVSPALAGRALARSRLKPRA